MTDYLVYDVFTDRPFGGNPLAIIPNAAELPEERLQRIAREFNFSETVFLYPPEGEGVAKVRIFTPMSEVPFAGHPVIGTVVMLGEAGLGPDFVLELGVGTGANFPLYSDLASEIHGIEPSEALLELAADTARQCNQPERFHLRVAGAEQLPYDDNSFDSVIACLVFCTIPDPDTAAREAFRVLKPGGTLLALEHVLSERRWVQRLQKGMNPAWKHLACGCQLTRDTASIFRGAGFRLHKASHRRHPKLPAFAGELLDGALLKPS